MPQNAPTLWTGQPTGPLYAWNDPRVRAVLDKALPPALQMHAGPIWLRDNLGSLADKMRAAYPGIRPFVAIAGDASGPDPSDEWADVATACAAANVDTIIPDPESQWVTRPAGMLLKSLLAIRKANPTIRIWTTTFGQIERIPNIFPPPTETGFSDNFPTQEMLGQASPCTLTLPQVYFADDDNVIPATRGRGPRSYARSVANYIAMWALGKVRPDMDLQGYLQLHGCRVDDLCTVAQMWDVCGWWVLSYPTTGYDTEGVRALWAMCELFRLGYTSRNAIVEFQRAAGLTPDGVVGPKTLAALGVVWP